MKTTNLKVAVFACIMILGLSNCNNSPSDKAEKVKDAKEDLIEAKADFKEAVLDSINEYAWYKTESEAKLNENDLKIAEIKAKLKLKKETIRNEYEKQLLELELKNQNLRKSIVEYKTTDNNTWETFKADFKHKLDELGKSISKISEE